MKIYNVFYATHGSEPVPSVDKYFVDQHKAIRFALAWLKRVEAEPGVGRWEANSVRRCIETHDWRGEVTYSVGSGTTWRTFSVTLEALEVEE